MRCCVVLQLKRVCISAGKMIFLLVRWSYIYTLSLVRHFRNPNCHVAYISVICVDYFNKSWEDCVQCYIVLNISIHTCNLLLLRLWFILRGEHDKILSAIARINNPFAFYFTQFVCYPFSSLTYVSTMSWTHWRLIMTLSANVRAAAAPTLTIRPRPVSTHNNI